MKRPSGYFFIYSFLGIMYIVILVLLLIPEKQQMAAGKSADQAATGNNREYVLQDYVALVGKHMILPDGTPTVVPIENPEELKTKEDLFAAAQKGDKLL